MAGKWSKSSSKDLADFYSLVLDYRAEYGVWAPDPATQEDLLIARAELERRGHLTPKIIEADKIIVAEGLHESYDYSAYGPKWPFHIHEIRAGTFDTQRLPKHLRKVVPA
jgi:hypothetical protein